MLDIHTRMVHTVFSTKQRAFNPLGFSSMKGLPKMTPTKKITNTPELPNMNGQPARVVYACLSDLLAGAQISVDEIFKYATQMNPMIRQGKTTNPSDYDNANRDSEGHGLSNWKRDNPIIFNRLANGVYLCLAKSDQVFFASISKHGRGATPRTLEQVIADRDAATKDKAKSKSFKVAPSTDARPKVAKKTATPTAHGVVVLPADSPASIIANQISK